MPGYDDGDGSPVLVAAHRRFRFNIRTVVGKCARCFDLDADYLAHRNADAFDHVLSPRTDLRRQVGHAMQSCQQHQVLFFSGRYGHVHHHDMLGIRSHGVFFGRNISEMLIQ